MADASTQGASRNIRLTIRTLRPSSHELTVPAELLVGELKDRLVELTGILHERQRLLFAGHALQDDQRLRERGVRDGHTIHLVERPEGATGGPPPPPQGGGVPGHHAPASATGMGTQVNWFSQLLGGLAGMGQQGGDLHDAAQGIPPFGITVGNVPGFGPASGGQQPAATAAQQPQQPAMALLSLVQHFITHLSTQDPAAAQPPPATVSYVLPEGRRQDSERRWYTAAQAVLQDAELRPAVRRFVETSAAASMAAATAGTGASRQQAPQNQDARLPTTVAVALGEMLRQTGELWRGRAADVLLTANTALSHLDQPIRPGQASDAIAQLQLANAQLFAVGALAWELSRMCSMLVPALSGSAALPLATGRSAFINALGTAPIMPMRVQPGLAGHNLLGFGGPSQQQPQGGTPVTVQLPNGASATGYFTGDAPSEAEFLQQLQYILGGQFGLPRPGEGPPQPAPAAGAASAAAGSGQTGHTGRRPAAANPGQSPPSGSHAAAVDTEMPDLVADSGSEYESEWEEADGGDEDTAAQSQQANEPHTRETGRVRSDRGSVHPNPSVTITFGDQMGMGGRWPFLGSGAGSMLGSAPTGPGAGSGAPAAANAWETLLTNPRLGAVQQELGRLVCAVVMPILSELLSQPQAGGSTEAGTADFVQDLSERISSALQPSLAAIHSMVQAVAPVLQARASGNAPAASRRGAQTSQAQRRAAAPQPSAPPAPATPAAEGMTEDLSAPADMPPTPADDSGEQQWAYIPTTTVSAEITVEPVDAAGQLMDTGDAAVRAPTSTSQTSNVMAALSASLPAIQQAVLDAMTPQQPAGVPSSDIPAAAGPPAADAGRSASGSAVARPQGSAEQLVTVRHAADTPACGGDNRPAGLGSSVLPGPNPSHSSEAQAAAPSGIGAGSGLPPRPAPARRGPSAGRRSRPMRPSSTAATGAQPEPGAAGPQMGQLGSMLASMLGGTGSGMASSSGYGGGNLAQMLGQIASSPAMQQLATSPALQNAVQPLLAGGDSQSGRQGAGQIDFGSLMNEMGPVLSQLMGNSGNNQPGASQADAFMPSAPAAGAAEDVTERPCSAPQPDAATQNPVDPAIEHTIRTELPAEQAHEWLDTLRSDAQVMRDIERRPLSSSYRAGSAHPPSSYAS